MKGFDILGFSFLVFLAIVIVILGVKVTFPDAATMFDELGVKVWIATVIWLASLGGGMALWVLNLYLTEKQRRELKK